jgi:hypothetical protein
VVEFARSRQAWFSTFLKLPNGIASNDTFDRVFRLIDAQALEAVCQQWLASLVGCSLGSGLYAEFAQGGRFSCDGPERVE